jgi:hypothetical protein
MYWKDEIVKIIIEKGKVRLHRTILASMKIKLY